MESTKSDLAKYFTEGEGDVWKCKCKKTRKKGRGWGNLMDHIQREHTDSLEEACKKESGPILHFFCKKDTNLFNWVEWIVKDLLPFNFCEKALVRKYTRLQPINVETLMKGLLKLTILVEQKIK